jgi:hypothetical protein
MSLSQLGGFEALCAKSSNEPVLMSIKSAREVLWRQLGEGAISAAAVDDAGDYVVVPQHNWAALVLAQSRDGSDYLFFRHNLLRAAYTELALPRLEILALWPALCTDKMAYENEVLSSATIPGLITFTIDDPHRRILFSAGPVLEGVHYELFALLAKAFREDAADELEKPAYRFVSTQLITTLFVISDKNLRQRVRRMRRTLERQFTAYAGYAVSAHTIVESKNWTGYRLNPDWVICGRKRDTSRQLSDRGVTSDLTT